MSHHYSIVHLSGIRPQPVNGGARDVALEEKIAVPTQVIRRAVVFIHEIGVCSAKMADRARGEPFTRRMASGPKNARAIDNTIPYQ
jgi:hypothetical protein